MPLDLSSDLWVSKTYSLLPNRRSLVETRKGHANERSTTKLSEHSIVMVERRDYGLILANNESSLGRKGMVDEGGDKRKSRPS